MDAGMICIEDVVNTFDQNERRCGTDTGGESLKRVGC